MKFPPFRSPRAQVGGLYHFGRLLDKIRLKIKGKLPAEYQSNLGAPSGLDGYCCGFLGIEFADLVERLKLPGTDEEVLEWCFSRGLRPNATQIAIWNSFAEKFGWRDAATAFVTRVKKEDKLTAREDLITTFEIIDFREGRSSKKDD